MPAYQLVASVLLVACLIALFRPSSLDTETLEKPGLSQVLESGKLNVITRNTFNTFYNGPDGPAGFEYELVKGFADSLGVELSIQIADDFVRIIPDLTDHRADMVAANLTVTDKRKEIIAFSDPYMQITQQLLYRNGTVKPRLFRDLAGKNIVVVANSSHADRLRQLQEAHPDVSWSETGEDIETLIELVDKGEIDFTIADSIDAATNKRFFPELRTGFNLTNEEPLAWAFPLDGDGTLLDAANEYIKEVKQSGFLEKLQQKYYEHINELDYVSTRAFMRDVTNRLPRLQELFYTAAARYDTDWQLLAAISYQESHWRTNAVSPTGVRGVMMLTRETASDLKVTDRKDPEQSIMGGTRYFLSIKKRLPERITEPDRTWMALAAYNVGMGHLEDARKLAETDDSDPDSWSSVRETLPLLSKRKWFTKTKYGYARGKEPVQYVRNIRNYYEMLIWLSNQKTPETMEADNQDIRIEFAPLKKEL